MTSVPDARPESEPRDFSFRPTPSVAASRERARYVDCSICRADHSQYLFHKVGVRFVRCRTCGMVYVNPITHAAAAAGPNWLDVDGIGQFATAEDRALYANRSTSPSLRPTGSRSGSSGPSCEARP